MPRLCQVFSSSLLFVCFFIILFVVAVFFNFSSTWFCTYFYISIQWWNEKKEHERTHKSHTNWYKHNKLRTLCMPVRWFSFSLFDTVAVNKSDCITTTHRKMWVEHIEINLLDIFFVHRITYKDVYI